jgi:hypothetical protein
MTTIHSRTATIAPQRPDISLGEASSVARTAQTPAAAAEHTQPGQAKPEVRTVLAPPEAEASSEKRDIEAAEQLARTAAAAVQWAAAEARDKDLSVIDALKIAMQEDVKGARETRLASRDWVTKAGKLFDAEVRIQKTRQQEAWGEHQKKQQLVMLVLVLVVLFAPHMIKDFIQNNYDLNTPDGLEQLKSDFDNFRKSMDPNQPLSGPMGKFLSENLLEQLKPKNELMKSLLQEGKRPNEIVESLSRFAVTINEMSADKD